MNASATWLARMQSAVSRVFDAGWGIPLTQRLSANTVTGVTAVVPLRFGARRLQAVLTLELNLAVAVTERLGAPPEQAAAQTADGASECLNLLAGRLAGSADESTELVLGIPMTRLPAVSGVVLAEGIWDTPCGAFSLMVEEIA